MCHLLSMCLVLAFQMLDNHFASSTKHLTSNDQANQRLIRAWLSITWQASTKHRPCKQHAIDRQMAIAWIVSYLTLVSDLDLAPLLDQFVAFPPGWYINPGCCVTISKNPMWPTVFLVRCPEAHTKIFQSKNVAIITNFKDRYSRCTGILAINYTNTHLVPIFEFDYDGHICSLKNFSMCLWTPYKGVLGWLKFYRGGGDRGGGCKKLKNATWRWQWALPVKCRNEFFLECSYWHVQSDRREPVLIGSVPNRKNQHGYIS